MKKNNRNDRDLLIAEISGDNYGRLLDEYTDELGGMIGVSIYIINIIDELLESEEYIKAIIYESDETHGNCRWQYFNQVHGTSLDWYFLNKANEKIEKEFPRLEKNINNMRIERKEVISSLVKAMIEDATDLHMDRFLNGFIGYANYSDKMLRDEYFNVFDEKITIVND